MEGKKEFGGIITIPPLEKGKSFVCYRDVNKAIEKHRELYGLRLALKRAVKLENYCLTVDQMKDLNLRLKYGELDYHCFAATGRPGRPGNDERCPQLIRLKLSADAQSLVVYESHNHNILPLGEGSLKNQQPLIKQQKMDFFPLPSDRPCFRGDITLTPINPVQKNPILILPKPLPGVTSSAVPGIVSIDSNTQGQPAAPPPPSYTFTKNFFINNNSFGALTPVTEINSITITPTINPNSTPPIQIYPPHGSDKGSNGQSSEGDSNHEKITMRIKKSKVVPNEMVIVGSPRDTVEQMHTKSQTPNSISSFHPLEMSTKIASSVGTDPKESSPKPYPQTLKVSKERIENIVHTAATTTLAGNSSPKTVSNNTLKAVNLKTNPKINNNVNSNPTTTGQSPDGSTPRKSLVNPKLGGVSLPSKSQSPSPGASSAKLPITHSQKDGFRPKTRPVTSASEESSPLSTTYSSSPTTVEAKTTKPTILKQSTNMKQVIIKKSPQSEESNKTKTLNDNKVSPSGVGRQTQQKNLNDSKILPSGVGRQSQPKALNDKMLPSGVGRQSQPKTLNDNKVSPSGAGRQSHPQTLNDNKILSSGVGRQSPSSINKQVKYDSSKNRSSTGNIKSLTTNVPKHNAIKTSIGSKSVGDKNVVNSSSSYDNRKINQRPLQNSKVTSNSAKYVNSAQQQNNQATRRLSNGTASDRTRLKGADKNIPYNGGNRQLTIPKKLKRKPGRPPDSSLNSNPHPLSLDTELGYSEKQQLAHGVLLQLLKVTSQLPMVEFSHALDTLEVVTDAFRLNQRVSLTIRHDQEDLLCRKEECDDEYDYFNELLKEEKIIGSEEDAEIVTSTTTSAEDLNRRQQKMLVSTQIDGAFSLDSLALKDMSTDQNSALSIPQLGDGNHIIMQPPQAPPFYIPQEPHVERMEVVIPAEAVEEHQFQGLNRANKRPALSSGNSSSKRRKIM